MKKFCWHKWIEIYRKFLKDYKDYRYWTVNYKCSKCDATSQLEDKMQIIYRD
jgi:hypothetical protein